MPAYDAAKETMQKPPIERLSKHSEVLDLLNKIAAVELARKEAETNLARIVAVLDPLTLDFNCALKSAESFADEASTDSIQKRRGIRAEVEALHKRLAAFEARVNLRLGPPPDAQLEVVE